MILEIIKDIKSFIIILAVSMIAFTQIYVVMDGVSAFEDVDDYARQSYVIAYGELGEFSDFTLVKFFIFVAFSFFIPLTLMNMLIAIMSDSYARVQSNAIAADTRQLSEMIKEYEELGKLMLGIFAPGRIKQGHYYLIFSELAPNDEEYGEWEGITGFMKSVTKDQNTNI